MKKHTYLWVAIALCLSANKVVAQQQSALVTDSITLHTLVEAVEKNTPYRIYTNVNTTLKVPAKANSKSSALQQLREALAPTPYKISIYKNALFILKEQELITQLPSSLTGEKAEQAMDGEFHSFFNDETEKATSENKLYNVGNSRAKARPATATLKGQITDFKTGDPMVGVNLIVKTPWSATASNAKGNFSIELPTGRVELEIKGVNIKDSRRQIMLYGNGTLNIELEESTHMLGEVTITSERLQNVKSTQMGVTSLKPTQLKNMPMALGEVDILKMVQSLPGVKTVGEASNGFNVRGGATDQNLILLNDGTIYNPNHLFGFFSAFNADMIKEAEVYKSSIPARYGGRISSVLDINSKEASKEKFNGSAGIGLVTSKLNLEIPVIKEKTSVLLSGRTTYSDWIMKALPAKSGYSDGTAGFYDFATNIAHKFNDKNNLNVYGYYSRDRFAFNSNEKYNYSNLNASAKWRTVLNEKLVGYFGVGYDHYDYESQETIIPESAYKLSFNINQFFTKADFSYKLTPQHALSFGFKTMLYDINAGSYEPAGTASLVQRDVLQKDRALETAFYIGDEWDITSKLSVNAGIRYSIFNALGPRTYYKYQEGMLPNISNITDTLSIGSGKAIKTYHGPEFRLSARYAFTDNFSVKAGFNSMRQYIHKLSNTVIMSPTDTWKLSDSHIKPQQGWQVASGLYLNSPDAVWEYSLEGYYKQLSDYLDYRGGAKLLMNHHIETDVVNTRGRAYGVEFQVKKQTGKLNGWVSYTYSRTFLQQNDPQIINPVNNGDWYPTDYDKPHDFKFVGNYRFTKRYSMSINVDYSTGRPTTVPAGQYYNEELKSMMVYYTDRNSYRIPDYFRTDFSFNIEPSHKLTLLTHSSISIGVYNLTGRRNVYSIYYLSERGKVNGYQMSIFGMPIPFITYNIKF